MMESCKDQRALPLLEHLVLDVRFLDNPYFVAELKHLPGTDPAVAKFVLDLPETKELLDRTRDLLAYVMPKYEREGKSYLTIAIGCTGGRHRSVVLADVLARTLAPVAGQAITVVHRDVLRQEAWLRPEAEQAQGDGGVVAFVPRAPDSEERIGVAPLSTTALSPERPSR